jgi:hypothetical protein
MKTLSFKITGVAPLIMHSGRLADPLNEWTKMISEISSKRGKTEADFEEMARLEFLGGMYVNGNGPCIPGEVLEGALYGRGGAARKYRMGKQAQASVFCMGHYDLEYDGPRDPLELWKDGRFTSRVAAKVQTAKIMRTRPIFEQWASEVSVTFNPDIVNADDIIKWMYTAGAEVGLMDWRPKFGRFDVEELG